jgi:hypothetical protein
VIPNNCGPDASRGRIGGRISTKGDAMTPEREQGFTDGWRAGVEQAILAHDDLSEALAFADAITRRYVGDRLADAHHECLMATMRKVRALRGEQGERDALALYSIEVAS